MKSKRAREAAEVDEKPIDAVAEAPAKKRKRDKDTDGDAASVKKSKKDKKKDKKESRKERKDKKKDLQDLPEEDGPADEEDATAEPKPEPEAESVKDADKKDKKKSKKDKSDKKDKKEKKDKKDKKDKKKGTENGEESKNGTDGTPPSKDAAVAATGDESPNDIDLDQKAAGKPDRHIVFVGNLPFTATAASISTHFASLSPIAVRCLKNRDDDKPCRGIAFVEFGKVWHQRTCLDKFHHSMFDDGKSPARKINVELTAGGGGKAKGRQEKIIEKNRKLDENRAKRIEKEKTAKEEGKAKQPQQQQQQQSNMEDSIHPSRRGRVPGMGH